MKKYKRLANVVKIFRICVNPFFRRKGVRLCAAVSAILLIMYNVIYKEICISYERKYYICSLPPLYDGILTDPRDLHLCKDCCQPVGRDTRAIDHTETLKAIHPGGYFKPNDCTAREQLAVIVPYREREIHLKTFLNYMHTFLQAQQLEYTIYIVEPALPTKFNRGILANIGVLTALNSGSKASCLVIHDVDLLPVDDRNLYVCSDNPRHMSSANSKFNNTLPYFQYTGGVISFSFEQYFAINGFSNVFFGWGGEDDDLRRRIWKAGFKLQRVPFEIGRYEALDHEEDVGNPKNQDRITLLKMMENQMKRDGLSSVKYTLLSMKKLPLYTWVYVALNESDYAISSLSSNLPASLWFLFYPCLTALLKVG